MQVVQPRKDGEILLKLLKGILKLLVFLTVLIIIGKIFFFDVARTNSYAMVPNLLPGDLFLVFKRARLGPGDMALCRDPENPGLMIVSRIIGVPGNTISITNNILIINGRRIQRQSEGNVMYVETKGEKLEFLVSIAEEKVGGTVYSLAFMDRAGDKNFDPVEVEEGFLLMGDNRNRSRDSRHFGEVPMKDCVGMPFLILRQGPDSGDFLFKNRFLEWLH